MVRPRPRLIRMAGIDSDEDERVDLMLSIVAEACGYRSDEDHSYHDDGAVADGEHPFAVSAEAPPALELDFSALFQGSPMPRAVYLTQIAAVRVKHFVSDAVLAAFARIFDSAAPGGTRLRSAADLRRELAPLCPTWAVKFLCKCGTIVADSADTFRRTCPGCGIPLIRENCTRVAVFNLAQQIFLWLNTARPADASLRLCWFGDGFQPQGRHKPHSCFVLGLRNMQLPPVERDRPGNLFVAAVVFGPRGPPSMGSLLRQAIEQLGRCRGFARVGTDLKDVSVTADMGCFDLRAVQKVLGFRSNPSFKACFYCTAEGAYAAEARTTVYGWFDRPPAAARSSWTDGYMGDAAPALAAAGFQPDRPVALDAMHLIYLGVVRRMVRALLPGELVSADDSAREAEEPGATADVAASAAEPDAGVPVDTERRVRRRVDPPALIRRTAPRLDPTQVRRAMRYVTEAAGAAGVPDPVACLEGYGKAADWRLFFHVFMLPALVPYISDEIADFLADLEREVLAMLATERLTPDETRERTANCRQLLVRYERLFGTTACTINVHVFSHLWECIERFGPLRDYWLYGPERFNGFLHKRASHAVRTPEFRVCDAISTAFAARRLLEATAVPDAAAPPPPTLSGRLGGAGERRWARAFMGDGTEVNARTDLSDDFSVVRLECADGQPDADVGVPLYFIGDSETDPAPLMRVRRCTKMSSGRLWVCRLANGAEETLPLSSAVGLYYAWPFPVERSVRHVLVPAPRWALGVRERAGDGDE